MESRDDRTHHDRIDFVYFRGKGVEAKGASVVGENKANADIVVAPWPSDHRAVVATFTLPNPPKSAKLIKNVSPLIPVASDNRLLYPMCTAHIT